LNKVISAKPSKIDEVSIGSGLFGRISNIVKEQVIPTQWDILNDKSQTADLDHSIENFSMACGDDVHYPSHCIANFRIAAKRQEGDFYGMVFQDSDLAKWLEAVSYSLMTAPDAQLEKNADEVIELIGEAQQEDGYLNTYFTIKEPEKRWTNLCEGHELYCAGHMMEAAVAYYKATGKRKLVEIMLKMADCINDTFGPADEGKLPGYPGHEEIELALVKMYEITGEEKLLKLAKYFLDERGRKPYYFDGEFERREKDSHFWYLYPPYGMYSNGPKYEQYHLPVREQEAFEGHAVRCMYLASGMADVARETGDMSLFDACKALYKNMAERRLYVTGGIGSTPDAEMFTFDYDLPNDLVYAETCASIGLVFFMQRMMMLEQDGRYADTMERALYNTCIAGMSLDGKNFFYVNPLEVNPEASRSNPNRKHVLPVRPGWFGCACCPPNLARLISSLGQYIYSVKEDKIFIHLYIGSEAVLDVSGEKVNIKMETEYPYEGNIKILMSGGSYSLCLRIPEWSRREWRVKINGKKADARIENGYALIKNDWSEGDILELELDMSVKRVYANPNVSKDVGKVALQRGPLVYCLEEADNGPGLQKVYLPSDALFEVCPNKEKLEGITEIKTEGLRISEYKKSSLYHYDLQPEYEQIPLTYIPYYTWANRGENEMTVWVNEKTK
jgi:hypothetical protein